MSLFVQTSSTVFCRVKLTEKGREYLLGTDSNQKRKFNLVKFSFGDSEIDYSIPQEQITGTTNLTLPSSLQDLISFQLYYRGTFDTSNSKVEIQPDKFVMSKNQDVQLVAFSSFADGTRFIEKYSWTVLGPLTDIQFHVSDDTLTAQLTSNNTEGLVKIGVRGKDSGLISISTIHVVGTKQQIFY